MKITFEQREKLRLGVEVVLDMTNRQDRTIKLVQTENLDSDGVTIEAIYRQLFHWWRTNPDLPPYPFPVLWFGYEFANPNRVYSFESNWRWADAETEALVKDQTMAELLRNAKQDSGVKIETGVNTGVFAEWNLTDEAREAISAGGWEVQGREYRPKEVRSLFLGHIRRLVNYCDRADLSKKESLEMLAGSILSAIDGKAPGLPAFELRPSPCPGDKEDAIEQGCDWFPEGVDIAGSLKEEFYQRSESCL